MTYHDSISTALHHAMDEDLPQHLWPLTIASEAARLCGLDSDRMGHAGAD